MTCKNKARGLCDCQSACFDFQVVATMTEDFSSEELRDLKNYFQAHKRASSKLKSRKNEQKKHHRNRKR